MFSAGLPLPAAPKQLPATPAAHDGAAAAQTPSAVPLRLLFAVLLGEFADREETAKPAGDAAPKKNGTSAETGEPAKHSSPFGNKVSPSQVVLPQPQPVAGAAAGADTAPLTLPTPAPAPIPVASQPVPLAEPSTPEAAPDLPATSSPKKEESKEDQPSIAIPRPPVWTPMRSTSIGRTARPAAKGAAPAIQTKLAPAPVSSPSAKAEPALAITTRVVAEVPQPTPDVEQPQPAIAPAKAAPSPAPHATRPAAAQKIVAAMPVQPRRSQPLNQPVAAIPVSQSTEPEPIPTPAPAPAPSQTFEIPQKATPLPPQSQPKPSRPMLPKAAAMPAAPVAPEKPIGQPETKPVPTAPAMNVPPTTAAALEPAPLPKPAPARRKEERTPRATSPATEAPTSATVAIAPLPTPVEPESIPEPAPRPPSPSQSQSPSRAEKNPTPPSQEPVVKRMVWPVVAMEGRNRAPLPTPPVQENVAATDDLAVRVVAPGARETGELAFTASLKPLLSDTPHTDAHETPATPTQRPALEHRLPVEPAEPAPAPAATESKQTAAPSNATHAAPKPAPARAHSDEPAPTIVRQTTPATPIQTPANPTAQSRESAPVKPAEAPEPTVRTTLETESQTTKQAGPAREIRLEMGSADARVEVKLSERAGELKVAVRTPDSHLAERLRADLPVLSSRLEDSGLRAETWRPSAVASNEARNTHEVSTAGSGGHPQDAESRQQGREQQQRQDEPRRQRAAEENEQPKEKGKDFEWFLSATQ